jgi:hypothetical protein
MLEIRDGRMVGKESCREVVEKNARDEVEEGTLIYTSAVGLA